MGFEPELADGVTPIETEPPEATSPEAYLTDGAADVEADGSPDASPAPDAGPLAPPPPPDAGPPAPPPPPDAGPLAPAAPPSPDGPQGPRYRTVVRRRGAKRRRRRRYLRLGILLAGLVVVAGLAAVADGYWQAYHIAKQVEAVFPKLEAARNELRRGAIPSEAPFTQVHDAVRRLEADLSGARFTFSWTGALPFIGRPVDATRLGAHAAGEADAALVIARDLYDQVLGSGSGPSRLLHEGVVNVGLIERLEPKVAALVQHLRAGDRDIRAIPHIPFLHRLDDLKATALAQSADALRLGQRIETGIKLLPGFFGADGPRNYFLALQNNADQRATGGASLGYGIIRIDNGRMELVRGGPISDLGQGKAFHVSAPKQIRWYLRHANVPPRIDNGVNYTPDFPVVAGTWARQVEKATEMHIDGVIAIDPVAVSGMLSGQPPIKISAFPQPITSDNVVNVTEHAQYLLPRKDQLAFPVELIQVAFHILTNPRNVPLLTKNLTTSLAEKRLQLWSADEDLQGLVSELGWDGALKVPDRDYLFLVDEKRLSNKVDYYTHQSITYTLKLDPTGSGEASVRVRLTNDTPPGEPIYVAGRAKPYGLNVAMLNLYVPAGAQDPRVTPDVPVAFKIRPKTFLTHPESENWLVLTKTVEAWPKNPAVLMFHYTLPHIVETTPEGNVYRLTIQHQPLANPAEITVNVLLPPGVTVNAKQSPGWKVTGSLATFHTTLTRDVVTTLVYS